MLLNEFKNNIQKKHNLKITQNEAFEESEESNDDHLLNEETTQEISTISEVQAPIENDFEDNLDSLCKEEVIELNSSASDAKIFLCHICNKEYNIYFHLKQHIRKFHEDRKSTQNDKALDVDEHEIPINENDKSILNPKNLEENADVIHIHKHKQYGINFDLKQHIKNVHEEKNIFQNKISAIDQVLNNEKINESNSDIVRENNAPEDFDSSHDEKEKCGSEYESPSQAGNLKKHFHKKDHKGGFQILRKHIFLGFLTPLPPK